MVNIKSATTIIITTFSQFIKGSIFRKSCYSCNYARTQRVGDFSIGDFWNVNIWTKKFIGINGVSAIMVNSLKGCDIWNVINKNLVYEESDIATLQKATHAVVEPVNAVNRNVTLEKMSCLQYFIWAFGYEHSWLNSLRKIRYKIQSR